MDSLNELIGQIVNVNIQDEDGFIYAVKSKVMDVQINDFYFEEKDEPILVQINAKPLEEIPKEIDEDSFQHVYLSDITKY